MKALVWQGKEDIRCDTVITSRNLHLNSLQHGRD